MIVFEDMMKAIFLFREHLENLLGGEWQTLDGGFLNLMGQYGELTVYVYPPSVYGEYAQVEILRAGEWIHFTNLPEEPDPFDIALLYILKTFSAA